MSTHTPAMAQDGDERQAVPKTLRELKEEKANYEAQQNYWFDSLTLTKKEEKLLIKIQKALSMFKDVFR